MAEMRRRRQWEGANGTGSHSHEQWVAGKALPQSREAGWGWAGVGEKTVRSDLDMLNL